MKKYTPADKATVSRCIAVIEKYHPELTSHKVRLDVIYVTSTDVGPALSLGGYACLATIKKVSVKDRAMGHGDAEMIIDLKRYVALTPPEQDALLDHELYHLVVEGELDSAGRPKLRLRLHDRQFGWFDEIAMRHGPAAGEVRQSTELFNEASQFYFPFAQKAKVA